MRNTVGREESSRTRDANDTGGAQDSAATSADATGRLEAKSFGRLEGPAAVSSSQGYADQILQQDTLLEPAARRNKEQ